LRLSALLTVIAAVSACGARVDSIAPANSDTGTLSHGTGLTGHQGEAAVDPAGSWVGMESWYFTANEGLGDPICLIAYDTTSTGVRTDCSECEWAFDLAWSHPRVDADEPPGCETLLGATSQVIASLDGAVASYGYTGRYFGHAEMIMAWTAEWGWAPLAWASYDEETGVLTYDQQEGYADY
jgi:hypothetical protein